MMETKDTNQENDRRTVTIITAISLAAGLLFGWVIDDLAFGLLIGFLVSLPFTARLTRLQTRMEYPPGTLPRIAAAGVTFFAGFFLANWAMDQNLDQPIKILLGSFITLPGIWFVYTLGKAISQLDEFQRRIQTEALAIGFGLSALMMIVVGLLADAGIAQPNWLVAAAAMSAFWLIGKLWTMWKYR
jgi:hypothetical protein